MLLSRKHIALLTLLVPLLLAWPLLSSGQSKPAYKVPITSDLQADGELAREKKVPLLIMFSQDGCLYCGQVLEEFLEPMRKSGDYTDRVIMRILKLDSYTEIRDFDGKWQDPMNIAVRYRARVTPTVIFVDDKGQELTDRILGISNKYYYGGELDDAIEVSLQRLRPVNVSRQEKDDNTRLQ